MISIDYVYTEICKNCDFPAPFFDIINKIVLKDKSIDIKFSNFIINHPENKLNDKCTFLKNNINVSIPKRGKSSSIKKMMSTYLKRNSHKKKRMSTYL